jgi:hypothetical protein
MADIAAKIDDLGKPAWIGLMVAAFILFWPVGLALLVFLIWSGRMGCWKRNGFEEMRRARGRWYGPSGWRQPESSGNHAFDEYRTETLRRLEEEQKEFLEFLERLRQAKDKAEFDQFMADRGRRSAGPGPQPAG